MKTGTFGIPNLFIAGSLLFSTPCFSASNSIGFSVQQDISSFNIQLTVFPNENVRPGDRLLIIDNGVGESMSIYAVPFVAMNTMSQDDVLENIKIQIPFNSKHDLSLSVAPVDSQTGAVYCGLSARAWHEEFAGENDEEINVVNAQSVSFDEACPHGYFNSSVNLRVENTQIIAEAPKSKTGVTGNVVMESFMCREIPGDPFGDCSKWYIARGNEKTSMPLQDVASNCSVTAQVVYANDQGRFIVSEEDAIRLAGYCPGGYTGIGFDVFSTTGAHHSIKSLSGSFIKWVADKISKSLGKKTAKEADKALRKCEISPGLFWKILSVIPYIGELLTPCVAGG